MGYAYVIREVNKKTTRSYIRSVASSAANAVTLLELEAGDGADFLLPPRVIREMLSQGGYVVVSTENGRCFSISRFSLNTASQDRQPQMNK